MRTVTRVIIFLLCGLSTVFAKSRRLDIDRDDFIPERFTRHVPDKLEDTNMAGVKINPVQYRYKLTEYELFIDDLEVREREFVAPLEPGKTYSFRVLSDDGRAVYSSNFSLAPGTIARITPREKWLKNWYAEMFFMGANWIGGGVDYFLSRYLWVGAGMGFSYWHDLTVQSHFVILTPYLEGGYYFLGDRTEEYRFALGGKAKFPVVFPYNKWEQVIYSYYSDTNDVNVNELRNYSFALEVFASYEWRFLYFTVGIQFDFLRPQFLLMPTLGIKF